MVAVAVATLIAPFALADGAIGDSACAAGESCVIASVDGASVHVISLADVRAGDVDDSYGLRATKGGTVVTDQFAGLSIRQLIQHDLALTPDSVTFVELSMGTDGPYTLAPADLADPGPYVDHLLPLIYAAGSLLGYIEPLRPGDDPNVYDHAQEGSPILLTVHTTGRLLTPVVTAGASTVNTGDSVSFTSAVADAPATTLSYDWDFGDGSSGSAASVAHVYPAAGTYGVTVIVRGADGSLGVSKPVVITVGASAPPAQSPGAATGGTSAPSSAPTAQPTKKPTDKPKPASKPRRSTATATPGPSSTPSSTPAPKPSVTVTPTPVPTDVASPVAPATKQVTGVLISGPKVPPSTSSPVAASSAAPEDRAAAAATLGWAGTGVAGTALLLVLGVLAESGALGSLAARVRKRIR